MNLDNMPVDDDDPTPPDHPSEAIDFVGWIKDADQQVGEWEDSPAGRVLSMGMNLFAVLGVITLIWLGVGSIGRGQTTTAAISGSGVVIVSALWMMPSKKNKEDPQP